MRTPQSNSNTSVCVLLTFTRIIQFFKNKLTLLMMTENTTLQ